jgi:Cu+-exporting ATPase
MLLQNHAMVSQAGISGLPFEPIGAAATLIGGYPVLKHGWADLRARRVSLSLSMSIGILAALGTGETFTSALMTLVVLLSEQLEVRA